VSGSLDWEYWDRVPTYMENIRPQVVLMFIYYYSRFCRGIDDRPVLSEHERKSVSAEVNYGIRFSNSSQATDFLTRLSEEVAQRLSSECKATILGFASQGDTRGTQAKKEDKFSIFLLSCNNSSYC